MKLSKYNAKRNFQKTKEPKGVVSKQNKSRFVIQHHYARKEHYDFRLEFNGTLISFAVPKGLSDVVGEKHLAVHVEDHPVDYINFKGKIPKGSYGAGTVDIFDNGTYIPLENFKTGLKKGNLKFELNGKKTKGIWHMIRTEEPNWLIIKSGEKTTKNIKKVKNPFNQCDVKLAKLSDTIPQKNYIFEIKYDGYRILSYISKKIELKSRNNKDYTEKFSSIAQSLKSFSNSMVLDGEVVVFDKTGKSNFGLLTESIKTSRDNFCYVVFDILSLDGKDIREYPLLKRKEILKNILKDAPKNIMLSSFVKQGKESFKLAQQLGLEGIVAKHVDSKYNGNRDDDWLKIKCYKRQEFVIGGYAKTEKNSKLSAIYVGYYKKNKLIFAGKVGTGFNEKLRNELDKKFKKIVRKTSLFDKFEDDNAIWIMPKYVAEIQYAELTKNNLLRQPSFVGLRVDKPAKNVSLEISDE